MNRILGLVVFLSISVSAPSQDKGLDDYGVEIIFSADDSIFPKTWLTKKINGKAEPLDTTEFQRSAAIIIKALNKYPVAMIKKNLTKVFFVKKLEFYGQSYGGTSSSSEVYLTNQGVDMGYSDFWIEQTFHSEFSSILFRNYSFLFDRKQWISYNKGIHYGQSGTQAIKQGKASTKFDFELNKRGVLSEYGTASIEEDFNMFAKNLFSSSIGFWDIGKVQKRIRKKTIQIIKFYHQIDNRFNEDFFRSVSKK